MHNSLLTGKSLSLLVLLTAALALAGCGHHHHDDGLVLVDNRTDLTTSERLLAFRLASFGDPFTGDLLGGDLDPGAARSLGVWREDFYDAEGDLELGQLIEWFDLFVGDGDTTVFEAR
jgi:hypothetical protein